VSGRRDQQGQELVAELQGLGAEAIFVPSLFVLTSAMKMTCATLSIKRSSASDALILQATMPRRKDCAVS
jgi:hypothetical protein